MSNVLNHFVIPPNSVGNVVGKCKHCKIDIKGHMKTTSKFSEGNYDIFYYGCIDVVNLIIRV